MSCTISIDFDKKEKVFMPDEEVSGTIEIIANYLGTKTCLGIKVNFLGLAEVYYTKEQEDSEGHPRKTEKKSDEVFYDTSKFIWGDGESMLQLTAGVKQHRFSFILPMGIPSSFGFQSVNLKCGIHHLVKAIVVFPSSHNNIVHIEPISVIPMVDLNESSEARFLKDELSIEKSHSLWVFCCPLVRTGKIKMKVDFNEGALVPGQKLQINARCSNNTLWSKTRSKFKLEQKVICLVEGEKKKSIRNVLLQLHPTCYPREVDVWNNEYFTIPPLAPSNLGSSCKIIEVKYYLKFQINPGGLHTRLSKTIEFPIGTIPLSSTFPSFLPPTSQSIFESLSHPQVMAGAASCVTSSKNYELPFSNASAPIYCQTDQENSHLYFYDSDLPPSYEELLMDKTCNMKISNNKHSSVLPSPSAVLLPETPAHESKVVKDLKEKYPSLPPHEFELCHFAEFHFPECSAYNVHGEEFAGGSHNELQYTPKFISYLSY